MDRIYDRLASLAVRFEKPLGWFGAVWLGLTGAVYARFITLPLIPYVTDENAFWLSGGFNVLYWSVLYPQIEKRKKALLSEAQKDTPAKPSLENRSPEGQSLQKQNRGEQDLRD